MDYLELVKSMTPELYRRMANAVETGKWPDGRPVTAEQRQSAMQALIVWGEENLPEQERLGFIDRKHKAGDSCDDPKEEPLNWK